MDNFDLRKYLAENKLNEDASEMTRVDVLAKALENVWNLGKDNNSIDFKDMPQSIMDDMEDNLYKRMDDYTRTLDL